ncbi:MAG: hypothetical protein ACTSVT_09105 [Candidatus Thorarchaeota archaeon]
MSKVLYVYDCRAARAHNARRVAFTKELYGYVYTWKTKKGLKQRKKAGLIDRCPGSIAISDSAIIVPREHKASFNDLFRRYRDILHTYIFEVNEHYEEL